MTDSIIPGLSAGNMPLADWNGEVMPLDQVRVSVLDRAFLFGDAVYEVLRVYGGRPFLCDEHFARLQRNLDKIRITSDVGRLQSRMNRLLEQTSVETGVVYIQVTRGAAVRTHRFPNQATPNELIYVAATASDPDAALSGLRVITVPDWRWKRCDIKSVNLLANCLGAQAAADAGCDEALLVEDDGAVLEGTHTSLFAVQQGRVVTPPLSSNILPGITRGLVLTLAERSGIEVVQAGLNRDNLLEFDELFLTGTTIGILPVLEVDGNELGNGDIGPIVSQLMKAYDAYVAEWQRAQTGM